MLDKNDNLTGVIYAKITDDLKKKTKKQSIDLGIDIRDYVALALEHYYEHVENEDLEANLV